MSVAFNATYYELAQRHPEVPRLTEIQKEALRVFASLVNSDRLRLDVFLQPGDLHLICNHNLVHTRSAFTDYEVQSALIDHEDGHALCLTEYAVQSDACLLPWPASSGTKSGPELRTGYQDTAGDDGPTSCPSSGSGTSCQFSQPSGLRPLAQK